METFCEIALAISTSCCSPGESVPARRFTSMPTPNPSTSRAASSASFRLSMKGPRFGSRPR